MMKGVMKLETEEDCGEPDLKKVKLDDTQSPEKNIVLSKLEPKLLPPPQVLTCPGLRVSLLGNNLNRLRLVGPLSSAVLRQCLIPAGVAAGTAPDPSYWWAGYYSV